jgi:hypothetical protein
MEASGVPEFYEIVVRGHLDPSWSAYFDGFTIARQPSGSVLRGSVIDQAALYGLLSRARDLGLTLLAVRYLATEATTGEDSRRS